MKKFLLSAIAMLCVSIGAWAQYSTENKTWTSCDDNSSENVIVITINTPGALSDAISSIVQSSLGIVKIKGTINDDDINALSNITVGTIDLQDAHKSDYSAFTFSNSSVRNLILPDGWTKEQVNNAASTIASVSPNFGSAYSFGPFKDVDGSTIPSSSALSGKGAITAYVNTPQTLRDVLIRSYSEGSNTKFGNFDQHTHSMSNIYGVTISGHAVAQDFFKDATDFTSDGHIVYDREADETQRNGETRTIVGTGTPKRPAFYGNGIGTNNNCVISLDLSGVIIDDIHNSDLTLSVSGLIGGDTRMVGIPTYAGLKTIPADFLNKEGNGVREICIPGNIQFIKTRAFHHTRVDHIWTTGNTADMKYDNGIYVISDGEEVEVDRQLSFTNPLNYNYGTYTFPEHLKLIESNAFCYEFDARVKDVYVLALQAPECHVDAFSTVMYTGNNTFQSPTGGIITREEYTMTTPDKQSSVDQSTGIPYGNRYITMLHYPRECGTPEVQRYTDPSREYSIATGEVDGKGSTIYFPNQNEFLRAYTQGTYGYVWNAWDPTRSDNGSNEIANIKSEQPYTQDGQVQANQLYIANSVSEDKASCTFYDTTNGGQVTKPAGQGNYWDVTRSGYTLYPRPESYTYYEYEQSVTGDYVIGDDGEYRAYVAATDAGKIRYRRLIGPLFDEDGDPICELDNVNGNYVVDQRYVEAVGGGFVENYVAAENGQLVQDFSYETDNSGDFVRDVIEDANGTLVLDYSYNEASGEPMAGVDYYYIPYVNRTNQTGETGPFYTLNTTIVQDDDGDWICPNGPGANGNPLEAWFCTITEYLNGDGTPEKVAAARAKHWTYSKVPTYVEDPNGQYKKGDYTLWNESVGDVTRYTKDYLTTYRDATDADAQETHYRDNGYRTYNSGTDEGKQRYSKDYKNTFHEYSSADGDEPRYNKLDGYRTFVEGALPDKGLTRYEIEDFYREYNASTDTGKDRYSQKIGEERTGIRQHDYRGWHQFVLNAFAHNKRYEMIPYRSFITDNDWWTVCLPFDLTFAEMIKFFGNESQDIPYLSKLTYVVRDVENQKITLMFSKNLMLFKETVASDQVHGTISASPSAPNNGDVVLHKGVPYLIRPNIAHDASGKITGTRQFDITEDAYHTADGDNCLYCRLKESQEMLGTDQMQVVYNGIYTVPAFVINNVSGANAESVISNNETRTIRMENGPTNTYENGTLTFKGKDYEMAVSNEFTYSFVGSFYLSLLPQYSYFLGWDAKNNCAAFWYNKKDQKSDYTWNNNTGIICANWLTLPDLDTTTRRIHEAGGDLDPARWKDTNSNFAVKVSSDDFKGMNNEAKVYTMDFGGDMFEDVSVPTSVMEIQNEGVLAGSGVYSTNGVFLGTSVEGLAKGMYIVNGKKYVVK